MALTVGYMLGLACLASFATYNIAVALGNFYDNCKSVDASLNLFEAARKASRELS